MIEFLIGVLVGFCVPLVIATLARVSDEAFPNPISRMIRIHIFDLKTSEEEEAYFAYKDTIANRKSEPEK